MPSPNPKRQRSAQRLLSEVFDDAANIWVVHYSCESFYNRPEGHSPRITSIALRRLDSAQTTSFSIHQIAERRKIAFADIEADYDSLEEEMLRNFFEHLKSYQQMKYLHWNMRDANYGFQAIEHRFGVLTGSNDGLYIVDDRYKIDLARIILDIYGTGYIGHPRMPNIISKNNISTRDFLTGEQEAEAFENKDYVSLHQSTLRKVDIIANIATRAYDRTLKTNTSWWGMHGGRLNELVNWIATHPKFSAVIGLATIIGVIIAIVTLL